MTQDNTLSRCLRQPERQATVNKPIVGPKLWQAPTLQGRV